MSTTCKVGDNNYEACTSPYIINNLTEGNYDIFIRAVDINENLSEVQQSFIVDTTAPVVTIDSGPVVIGAETIPSFVFTTSGDPVLVQCRLDDEEFTTCSSPYETVAQSPGNHVFTVRVTDAAGNSSEDTYSFIVDNTVPTIHVGFRPETYSRYRTHRIAFSTTEQATVECQLNDAAYERCTSPYELTDLDDGEYNIRLRATDLAGNSSEVLRRLIIDNEDPVAVFTEGPGAITNDITPTFAFTLSEPIHTISCGLERHIYFSC